MNLRGTDKMMLFSRQRTAGFSLVELSVVLIIVSLLVGAALAGGSLIKSARIKGTMQEVNDLSNAYHAFVDQYNSLPGDMPNATSFWGAADGAGAGDSPACMNAYTDGIETCNGNDSGSITPVNINIDNTYEHLRAMQHMKNAGLIEGNYSGILDPGIGLKAGFNSPPSSIDNGLYTIHYHTLGGARKGTTISLGSGGSINVTDPVITPKDAFAIDSKFDNGDPNSGSVYVVDFTGNCSDFVVYHIDNPNKVCTLNFWVESVLTN